MFRILAFLFLFSLTGCISKTPQKIYASTTIEIKVEEQTSLLILLYKDGTINRKGDGTLAIDSNFYMGIQNDSILQKLTKTVSSDFLELFNKIYDISDKKGKTCTLEITLTNEQERKGLIYTYGSESGGLPVSISNYVKKAIELTDPWYKNQAKMVENNQ